MIDVAKKVNKAVLLEIAMPTLEYIKPIVEMLTVDPVPMSISVIINNNFFLLKLLYVF